MKFRRPWALAILTVLGSAYAAWVAEGWNRPLLTNIKANISPVTLSGLPELSPSGVSSRDIFPRTETPEPPDLACWDIRFKARTWLAEAHLDAYSLRGQEGMGFVFSQPWSTSCYEGSWSHDVLAMRFPVILKVTLDRAHRMPWWEHLRPHRREQYLTLSSPNQPVSWSFSPP